MIEILDKKLKGYKFIDLFAGIGGFHYAMKSFGADCVFADEWDVNAKKTYFENHGIMPEGDITQINEVEIPPHDILCGGFPCQAFSISGKQLGFNDTRGTLFFDIARIVKHHKPLVVFMENVKNLVRHDTGKTFKVVQDVMTELGYNMHWEILNSGNYGVPQHRERVYMVALRNDIKQNSDFHFPKCNKRTALYEILESNPQDAKIIKRQDTFITKQPHVTCINLFGENEMPNRPIQIGYVNKGGQGERIYDPIGHAITLSAYGGGAGSKTGLYLIDGVIRKLSPRECARCQGFPEDFVFPKPNIAYKQFGNSVTINVLQYIINEFSKLLPPKGK